MKEFESQNPEADSIIRKAGEARLLTSFSGAANEAEQSDARYKAHSMLMPVISIE
jgi:hypothetical protein